MVPPSLPDHICSIVIRVPVEDVWTGEVLEVDAPRRLEHTHIFAMKPEPPTVVTWELEPVPEGTKVTLTHAGWTGEHTAFALPKTTRADYVDEQAW